jgi:plastocyanin
MGGERIPFHVWRSNVQGNFAFTPSVIFPSCGLVVRFAIPIRLFLILVAPAAAAIAAPSGGVTGVVPLPARPAQGRIAVEKYTGTISGKVAAPPPPRAGVWLEGPGAAPESPPATLVLGQEGYQFSNSLIIVTRGGSVRFPNHDNDYHNIYSLSRAKRFDLGRYKKDEAPAPVVTFDKAGLVRLKCEIHDHMNATVLVVDSRWHALTDSAGSFSLTGIPAGAYTLHAQLDEKHRWSVPVMIVAGTTVTAEFRKPSMLP